MGALETPLVVAPLVQGALDAIARTGGDAEGTLLVLLALADFATRPVA